MFLFKLLISSILLMSFSFSTLSADVHKGQKLYLKKLKSKCKLKGNVIAAKHTVSEWEDIFEAGDLSKEIQDICPKVKDKSLKQKYMIHYFDFFKEYGSDSGNVPSCG